MGRLVKDETGLTNSDPILVYTHVKLGDLKRIQSFQDSNLKVKKDYGDPAYNIPFWLQGFTPLGSMGIS